MQDAGGGEPAVGEAFIRSQVSRAAGSGAEAR